VRIERPPYYADVVLDTRSDPPVWHCIVQRQGSSNIIAWFQENSEQQARQSATRELDSLRREDLVKAGQLPLTLNPGA